MHNTVHMKNLRSIMEGKKSYHQELLETIQGDEFKKVYLEWYQMGAVLAESKISQDQIQQIFKAISAGAIAGKNVDAVGTEPTAAGNAPKRGIIGSISQGWSNFKDKISQSAPISGFDVKFDALQSKLLGKVGGQKGKVGKMLAAYKEFGNKYPRIQSALYYGLTIIAAISGWGLGGVAVAAGLRTLNGLLQGDRLSSAAWKGIKAAVLGAAAGELFGGGGGGAEAAGVSAVAPSAAEYTVQSGDTLSAIAAQNSTSVDALMQANSQITNPDVLRAGQEIKIPGIDEPVYKGGVGTAADTIGKIGTGQYTDSAISQAAAAKAGLRESIIDKQRIKRKWQIQESLKLPQRSPVYVTQYGISKIFEQISRVTLAEESYADYQKKAKEDKKNPYQGFDKKLDLFWRKNYGEYSQEESVDVNTVMDFLRRMGVKDTLIKSTLSSLKIPVTAVTPASTASTAAAPATAASTAAAAEPAKSVPAISTEPKPEQEFEFPGTNVKFKYTPQWLTADGKPASAASAKVLSQLAAGVRKSDLDTRDLIAARRELYKGSAGMTENKKIIKKSALINKKSSRKIIR